MKISLNSEAIRTSLDVLQQGQVLSDPATWKNRQLVATTITGMLTGTAAVAKLFGVDVGMDADTFTGIGLVAATLVHFASAYLTVATSEKVGLATAATAATAAPAPAPAPKQSDTDS